MPKAYPDFVDAAERYLDGELTAVQKEKFLGRIRKDKVLQRKLREMKFARDAMKVYRLILPPAREFTQMRKRVLAEI
jgi:hypothetical protein